MYNYSEKHNVLFVHIPKNAGTSIVNSLGMDSAKVKHYPLSILQTYIPKDIFDNAIKVAVFRSPFERMVSYHRHRINKQQDPKKMPFNIWLRDGTIQYNMNNYDALPQIKWCTKMDMVDLPNSMDYILNFEKLNEQWSELCQIENLDVKPLQKLNNTGDYDYTDYYKTLEDMILVNHLYRTDVSLFRYHFSIPNDFPLLKGKEEIDNFLRGK